MKNKKPSIAGGFNIVISKVLAPTYSRTQMSTTIGTTGLNFCVRNENR